MFHVFLSDLTLNYNMYTSSLLIPTFASVRKEVCRYLGRHGTNQNRNQGFCSREGENKAEARVKEVRHLRLEV